MGADYLGTIADDLLDAATAGINPARTGRPLPERIYVCHGDPAVDACTDNANGQLTVHLLPTLGVGRLQQPSGPAPRQAQVLPVAWFGIQLWRCHPAFTEAGAIPDAADLEGAAGGLLTDLWCLMTYLWEQNQAGTLTSVPCRSIDIGDATPQGPSGGAAGWEVQVTVGLSDVGPVIGP